VVMWLCGYAVMCVHVFVCVCVCVRVSVRACGYICLYLFLCMCEFAYVQMFIWVFVFVCVFAYTFVNRHIFPRTSIICATVQVNKTRQVVVKLIRPSQVSSSSLNTHAGNVTKTMHRVREMLLN